MVDHYRLERFVSAQDRGDPDTYRSALSELRAGRKQGHWMWYVFPQIAGLGQSAMSRKYAISSIEEARAYLAHQMLGPRLLDCAGALADLEVGTAVDILGGIDAVKLRSSMTLFGAAEPDEPLFQRVLDKYFDGQPDTATLSRL